MADPLCHAVQGSLMLVAPFMRLIRTKFTLVWLTVSGALLGDLPDILGVLGFYALHDNGRLYFSAHFGAIKEIIQYIPMCWLHLAIDSFTHELADRRSIESEWVIIEFVAWALNIVLILWLVRFFRRRFSLSRQKLAATFRLPSKNSVPFSR